MGGTQGPLQPPRHRDAGFTIVELLIVLTLMSMIASLGIPAYFGRPSITLDAAAKLLAKDLREVQNRAALYEEPLEIRFADRNTGYAATDVRGESLISPYGAGPFLRDYPFDAVFRGVYIESVKAGGDRRVTFSAEGRPIESAEITLAFKEERRTVRIRKRSGLLSIDGLDEPWVDFGD
ncbi:MAG: type II secretion system protein [Planctomycetota bacterium]